MDLPTRSLGFLALPKPGTIQLDRKFAVTPAEKRFHFHRDFVRSPRRGGIFWPPLDCRTVWRRSCAAMRIGQKLHKLPLRVLPRQNATESFRPKGEGWRGGGERPNLAG